MAVDDSHIYWTMNDPNGASGSMCGEMTCSTAKTRQEHSSARTPNCAASPSTPATSTGRARAKKRSGGPTSSWKKSRKQFIQVAGKPKGLATEGSDLWWSLNGETVPNPGNDLYRYRAADESLLDLTADSEPADVNGAEVKGVLGVSEDGKRVYLAANGDLDGGGPAQAGDCKGSVTVGLSFSGQCSLYLARRKLAGRLEHELHRPPRRGGGKRGKRRANWIARGGAADSAVRYEKSGLHQRRRQHPALSLPAKLSDYDNEGQPELYRYRSGGAGADLHLLQPHRRSAGGAPRLASIGLSALTPQVDPAYVLARNLSADGKRAFFETTDPLVIDDTNGEEGCPTEVVGEFHLPLLPGRL